MVIILLIEYNVKVREKTLTFEFCGIANILRIHGKAPACCAPEALMQAEETFFRS